MKPALLILSALLMVTTSRAGEAAFDAAKISALEDSLRGYVTEGRVPCVVAVLDRPGVGECAFVLGSRDIGTGEPVRRDTIFCIYSITKMMTATAILQLVEDGKIGLDDPVGKYLPELAGWRVWAGGDASAAETVSVRSPPTIRQLLTHTAGLYYDTTADPVLAPLVANMDARPFLKAGDFLDFIAKVPLNDQPGTKYRYSMGYAVLGLVVERASGRNLEDFMQERIFRPLGMTDTGFVVPAEKRQRLARICRHDADGKLFIDPASEARVPARGTFFAGGGDLFSTADDLVRFGRMLLNKGELDSVRVLRSETVELMTRDQLGGLPLPAVDYMARDTYGFGVGIATRDSPNGVGLSGAFGWSGNATTLLQIDPKANLVAVILSQVRPGQKDIYRDFLQGVYRAVQGRGD